MSDLITGIPHDWKCQDRTVEDRTVEAAIILHRDFGPEKANGAFAAALNQAFRVGGFLLAVMLSAVAPALAWEHWGGDRGGMRFSPLAQITPANVGNLVRAWEFRTGDLERRAPAVMARTKFQATPLLVEDSLIFCSPFNEVIALDPGSGAQKWRYDPQISTEQRPANRYNCRGVAWWIDDQLAANAACRARIFMGTNDARVIALDARTGIPCADFGTGGAIKLDTGQLDWPGEFQITSAPVVSRGVVIVGSAISDNRRAEAPPGTVRAFDARTGRPRWSFDPLVHSGIIAGHANVWAPMSADEDRGLVFLPTSSPSPDFWGGKRPGNNEHANSVVALRAETGELVWSFQTVHHDVWDYDVPAQPTLARIDTGQGMRDVVIQPTKQGLVFVLDRDTGKPVWPVEERARAARRGGGRAAVADAAVSHPRAGAGAADGFRRTMCSASFRSGIARCAASSSRPRATRAFTRRPRPRGRWFFR